MQTATWIYIAITTLSIQATTGGAPTSATAGAKHTQRTPAEPTAAKLPRLRTMQPSVNRGRLDSRTIRRVVRNRRPSIAHCYERSLRRDEKLSGKLAFVITVAPTGIVTGARLVSKKHAGTPVAGCIQRKLATWRFPTFRGAAQDVLLPFRLEHTSRR